jgi:predicted SAM-dependent methyltransferase
MTVRSIAEEWTKLEVGSGNNPAPGYQHADIDPSMPELDYVCSLDCIPAFDNTFDEVRSVHSIEHVSLNRATAALREWYRILKPGGKVYVDTPNIQRNVRMYVDGSWRNDYGRLNPDEQLACSHKGNPNAGLWLNFKIFSDDDSSSAWNLHRWNADPELLWQMLENAGFVNIKIMALEPSLIIVGFKP